MNITVKKKAIHSSEWFNAVCAAAKADTLDSSEISFRKKGKFSEMVVKGKAVGFTDDAVPEATVFKIVSFDTDAMTIQLEAAKSPATQKACGGVTEAAEKGGLSPEEAEERVKVMKNALKFPPQMIKAVMSSWQKFDSRYVPDVIYQACGQEAVVAMASLLVGRPVLLKGPKSTGKNVLIGTMAYVLGLPYYRKNLDTKAIAEDLFGSKGTDNSAAEELKSHPELADAHVAFMNGDASRQEEAAKFESLKAQASCIRLTFQESEFVKWARTGGLMNLDEINFWPADIVQEAINPIADGERVINSVNTGTIHLNRNCFLMAGMNPGYEGTNELNEATESRFTEIILDYPEDIMKPLKANFNADSVPEKYFKVCSDLFRAFAKMYEKGLVSDRCLNIRGMVAALKMAQQFPDVMKLNDAIMASVINACEADERSVLKMKLYEAIDF